LFNFKFKLANSKTKISNDCHPGLDPGFRKDRQTEKLDSESLPRRTGKFRMTKPKSSLPAGPLRQGSSEASRQVQNDK